jgi:hypothetical protein
MEITMKRALLPGILFFALTGIDLFAQGELSGKWLRDDMIVGKDRLPRITWLITVDEMALTVVELSARGETLRQLRYNLDGTETRSVSQSPKKESTYRFKWNKSKRTAEIREIQVVSFANIPPQKYEIKETWELTNSGKTLKVVQKIDSGNSELLGFELLNSKETFQRLQ